MLFHLVFQYDSWHWIVLYLLSIWSGKSMHQFPSPRNWYGLQQWLPQHVFTNSKSSVDLIFLALSQSLLLFDNYLLHNVSWEPEGRYCSSDMFPLRTRRVLSLYKVCGDSALLVLNGTSLICNNALMIPNLRYSIYIPFFLSIVKKKLYFFF